MKVILQNAVTLDGFIATLDGDSDWAADDEEFAALFNKIGCILIGRKTYEQYKGDIFPLAGGVNYVYTHDPEKWTAEATQELRFIGGSPHEALNNIQKQGFDTVMLAGGGEINASFAQAGLIDEMILHVHPLLLGKGIQLLGPYNQPLNLEFISSQFNPKGFVQNHYKVK
jgi:dihydrofolate reductase